MSGGVLPENCRVANKFGVRGGVEGAFMSTTTNNEVAAFYAKGGAASLGTKKSLDQPALLFETQMGLVDRGADISWLSQFPHARRSLGSHPAPS